MTKSINIFEMNLETSNQFTNWDDWHQGKLLHIPQGSSITIKLLDPVIFSTSFHWLHLLNKSRKGGEKLRVDCVDYDAALDATKQAKTVRDSDTCPLCAAGIARENTYYMYVVNQASEEDAILQISWALLQQIKRFVTPTDFDLAKGCWITIASQVTDRHKTHYVLSRGEDPVEISVEDLPVLESLVDCYAPVRSTLATYDDIKSKVKETW